MLDFIQGPGSPCFPDHAGVGEIVMPPDIRLKRIYEPASEADGARILVDRLWPRGVRKEDAHLTLWMKEIAPSPELRKWFCHDPALFGEFTFRYQAELDANHAAVAQIADYLKHGPVTLLYAAHDPAHNQAVVLADYLRTSLMGVAAGDGGKQAD
ncbi:hypothetical protein GCM10019059_03540 [Camelimonas fluminis]|nr:hypothetical protein GCM10019059_03540 [Camelimonas fluminis]